MIICDRCTEPLPSTQDVEEVFWNKTKVFSKHFCDDCNTTVFNKLILLGEEAQVDER